MKKDWTEPDYADELRIMAPGDYAELTCECGKVSYHSIIVHSIPAQVLCPGCGEFHRVECPRYGA